MKIALINPRVDTFSSSLPPLGLLYIGAVLEKEGLQIRIYDPAPDDDRDIKRIIAFQPDVIAVSILTSYVNRARRIIFALKKCLKPKAVVIGGIHTTALPEDSLNLFGADFAVIGEGEATMRELCLRLREDRPVSDIRGIVYRAPNSLIRTAPREAAEDLEALPLPARHLIDFERYLFPPGVIRGYWSDRCTSVMTSRGCPFQCIWCGKQTMFGRRVRRRSTDSVVAEIRLLRDRYAVDTVWFVDDTFTANKKWVLEFCDKFMDNGLGLKWGCQAHVTTVDEEMVVAMKRAGLVQLDFGVESGSDRVLKALKKNSGEEAVKRAFRVTKKVGVRTMATFMFGNPEETQEDVKKTFMLAREIKPDYISSYFLTPYPGTELMDMARDNKWLVGQDYMVGTPRNAPLLKINFSSEELQRIRSRFQAQFLWTNFFNMFFNLDYFPKLLGVIIRYPKGALKGLLAFLKTRVFDDFVFYFLIYYAGQRQKMKVRGRKA